jgi:hypothetical protein
VAVVVVSPDATAQRVLISTSRTRACWNRSEQAVTMVPSAQGMTPKSEGVARVVSNRLQAMRQPLRTKGGLASPTITRTMCMGAPRLQWLRPQHGRPRPR